MTVDRRRALMLLGALAAGAAVGGTATGAAAVEFPPKGGRPRRRRQRALVLGGGGTLGAAWESGLLTALAKRRLPLTDADLILGTSAGSVVGAYLALGAPPAQALELVEAFRAAIAGAGTAVDPRVLIETLTLLVNSTSAEEGLRAVGQRALAARTVAEETYVDVFAGLDKQRWPAGFACTAIDTETGAQVVWDRHARVPLGRALASSCAAPLTCPPVTIHGRRYMDGGMLTPLRPAPAAGYRRVVAVSAFPVTRAHVVANPIFQFWADQTDTELAAVRCRAESLAVIDPGSEFRAISAAGTNLNDATRIAEAHEAGIRQAAQEFPRVLAAWRRP